MQSTLDRKRMYHANQRGKGGSPDFNCWGATLFVLGHAKRLNWKECQLMTSWLENNTKKIKQVSEPGDILAIWSHWSERLEHTAVYIGRDRWFHKRGMNKAEITTLREIKKIYEGKSTFHKLKGGSYAR